LSKSITLSIERNPFSAKNQTLSSYQSKHSHSLSSSYPN